MKYLEVFLLSCLAAVAGYTLCAWSPKPHLVQVMDQGKPICPKGMTCDASKYHIDPCNYYDYALSVDNCQTVPIQIKQDATAGNKILRLKDPTAEFQIIDARDPLIVALGQAIAREEGFGKPGTLATVNHNPGNLIYAHQQGAGIAIMLGASEGYATFLTDDAGWAALYADLRVKKATGKVDCEAIHREYGHNMSVDECRVWEIAYNWSTGDPEKYARDVVADLKARGLLK